MIRLMGKNPEGIIGKLKVFFLNPSNQTGKHFLKKLILFFYQQIVVT